MLPYTLQTWIEGEYLKATEFNEQIEQNLEWVRKRNIDYVVVRNGVSDQSLTVAAGWQPLLPTVFFTKLVTRGGDIMLSLNLSFNAAGASGDTTFDIEVKAASNEFSFFLSTLSGARDTNPALFYEQYGSGYTIRKTLRYLWTSVPANEYTFTIWWLAGVGNSTINFTNTINEFIVEEYCNVYGN